MNIKVRVVIIISGIVAVLVAAAVGLLWMQMQTRPDYTDIAYVQIIHDNDYPDYDTYYIDEYTYEDEYANYDHGDYIIDYEYEYDEDDEPYEPYVPFTPIFTSEPLPDHIIAFITGVTFREYTPFTHDFLTYLTITHINFDGEDQIGHMIVAAEIGDEVLEIFQEIYEAGFPIYSIKLIDYFDAIDYYSLAANNSSAFNFRYIANTTTLSRHALGMAIDINPIQNPYVRGDNVLPEAGRAYLDRTDVRPGMIVSGDAVYEAFISRGWIWGGHWTLPRDYHHFERRG